MGLLRTLTRCLFGDTAAPALSLPTRNCLLEPMEPRQMLSAAPLYVGAVYIENDDGSDAAGDTFEISFVGGADGTELTRVAINGDQDDPGFSRNDIVFDTEPTGIGVLGAIPFQVVSREGIDSFSVEAVEDGESLLVLHFSGFHAGEKFVFTIDVDQVLRYDTRVTDVHIINQEVDALTSGAEFQTSRLTADFTAPHYHDVSNQGEFRNAYDLGSTGLDLSEDNFDNKVDRTAAAVAQLVQQPKPVTIAGTVYHDIDVDLTQDSGEPGLRDVTLALWKKEGEAYVDTGYRAITDEVGDYIFGHDLDLLPGIYQVRESQPDGYFSVGAVEGTVEGQPTGRTVPGDPDRLTDIDIPLGDMDAVDYDFAEALPVSIAGNVHESDANGNCFVIGMEHPAIPDVRVQLYDAAGSLVDETTTDANGDYSFTGLRPGTYTVREIQPDGYFQGSQRVGWVDNVETGNVPEPDVLATIRLNSGQDGVFYDFCEHPPVRISGHVYHDESNDGVFDNGEDPIANARLQLFDAGGNLVATTVTDGAGHYEFTGLPQGTYRIVETQPAAYLDGLDTPGTIAGRPVGTVTNPGDEIGEVSIQWHQAGIDYDFGELLPGEIRGNVHESDWYGNCFVIGIYHVPIVGVTIQLQDSAGNLVAETQTDENGDYRFDHLAPGVYTVVEIQPAGYLQGGSRVGWVDGVESGEQVGRDILSGIEIGSGQAGTYYDFCEPLPASLSGHVYHDANNNGLFEASERPIEGVTVTLYDSAGQQVAAARTHADGLYEFAQLYQDTYTIVETQPAGWLDGIDAAGTVDGAPVGQAVNPGDRIGEVEIKSGQRGIDYDFGEVLVGSISGYVHVDKIRNCVFDEGEPPIEGVTVHLLDDLGQVVATTHTNTAGFYKFGGLEPSLYSVTIVEPSGYFHGGQVVGSGDGDASEKDQLTDITIGSGQHLVDYNFCKVPPGSISGYVFQDGPTLLTLNGEAPDNLHELRDGQRTPDDTPIAGVVLELRDGLSGDPVTADRALPGHYGPGPIRTTTDANGHYEFTGLKWGNYAVYEIHPDGYIDSRDTPGTLSGIAFNRGEPVSVAVLGQLTANPRDDAIVRIGLPPGERSEDNNFSEVRVTLPPPPPVTPPIETPPVVEIPLPPIVQPPIWIPPVLPVAPPEYVAGGSGAGGHTWHLSVINSGRPRGSAPATVGASTFWLTGAQIQTAAWGPQHLSRGLWTLARQTEDGRIVRFDREHNFGLRGAIPVVGDFNGDGIDEIAVYYKGEWYVDLNGDGVWDEADLWAKLGTDADQPVAGDWDGDGKDDIGIYGPAWPGDPRAVREEPGLPDPNNLRTHKTKNIPPKPEEASRGSRVMQLTSQGRVRADLIDHVFHYGTPGDRAISGDWNGDGIEAIGIFRNGRWYLDIDADGRWSAADAAFAFGQEGDLPVVGDFNGDGIDEVGLFRSGTWILDSNGNRELDAEDRSFEFGEAGDRPVAGDFDGDGTDDPGLYRDAGPDPGPQARRS